MRTIQNQLIEKGFADPSKQQETRKTRPKENLSSRELKELMGVNTPTYRRSRGGAIRQK